MKAIELIKDSIDKFEREGALKVENFFSKDDIDSILRSTNKFVEKEPENGKWMVYFEENLKEVGKKLVCRVENFVDYDSTLFDVAYSDKLLKFLEKLCGEKVILFKDKMHYKFPGGDGFKPHQDVQAKWDKYARYFITVMVSVDESMEENGCVRIASGHHKKGLIGRYWEPLEGNELNGIEFSSAPTKPGDIIIFDSFTPHYSEPNMSSKTRRALFFTYNEASQGDYRQIYFAEKRKNFPPDNERKPGSSYKFRV